MVPVASASSGDADPSDVPAVLIDVTRCVGCGNCQRACGTANDLTPTDEQLSALGAQTYTVIERYDVTGGKQRSVKRQCMHCLHPACVSACTVGALHKSPEGVVALDSTKCIGCRYCQYACPFGVPKFDWQSTLGLVSKCQSCLDRLRQGQAPACTAACPSGALKAGKRGDLLTEAHARIRSTPGTYINHIYGEHEVGGTNRLYISDVPFDQLGFPTLGAEPAPRYAEAVMTRTPVIAAGVAILATGLYTAIGQQGGGRQVEEISVKEEK
jgi:formate dehydrogenase iron-sulfur subunit